jgi:hypothetical protein
MQIQRRALVWEYLVVVVEDKLPKIQLVPFKT